MHAGLGETTTQILTLAAMLLVPLVPALALFWILPSDAKVEGPFKGLKIKLGGAFAGYFLLVLVVFERHETWAPPPPAPQYQVWEVDGTISDENGKPLQLLEPGDLILLPPTLATFPGGNFKVTFYSVPSPGGQGSEYPKLLVTHQGFGQSTVELDPQKVKATHKPDKNEFPPVDESARRIHLNTVKLPAAASMPQYQPKSPSQ